MSKLKQNKNNKQIYFIAIKLKKADDYALKLFLKKDYIKY